MIESDNAPRGSTNRMIFKSSPARGVSEIMAASV